ncbi:MAG: peptide chain release factor-like protein [Elusimicrobiota bacterium]
MEPFLYEFEARMKALSLAPSQVTEDFIRSGGKGGQNVNKVSTCVVLRHLPTGLMVRCSEERSQYSNRRSAWLRLIERLEQRRTAALRARRDAAEKERRRNRKRPQGLKESILREKKRRAETKSRRGRVDSSDY